MHVTLATMIMYYETRFKSKESEHVLARMRDAYDAKILTPGFAAHQVLIEWGDALKIQFKLDNAHLFNRKGHDLSEQVVAGLQGLGGNVARMSAQISDLATRTISLEHQNSVLLQQMQQMMRIIAQQQQLLLARPPVVDGPSPQLPPLPPLAPLAPAPVITPLAGSPEGRQFITSGIIIIIFGSLCKSNCGPFRGLEWFSPVPGALPDVTEAVPSQCVVNKISFHGLSLNAHDALLLAAGARRMRSAPCRSPVVIHTPHFSCGCIPSSGGHWTGWRRCRSPSPVPQPCTQSCVLLRCCAWPCDVHSCQEATDLTRVAQFSSSVCHRTGPNRRGSSQAATLRAN